MALKKIVRAALAGVVVVLAALLLFTWYTANRAETAVPPQGRIVDTGGVAFHVREQGQGRSLLLIHGLAGQMRHFDYGVAEQLAKDFRVVAIDRPGSGYSERAPDSAADVSAQAASIAALIDAMQLDQPFVVGHSLGGAVALALALDHPQHVSGLALIAPLTHLPPDQAQPPEAFKALTIESAALRQLLAWTLVVPGSIARSAEVLEQVFGPEAVPEDFGTRGGGLLALRPAHFIAASRDMQALPHRMPDLVARYPALRLPISILYARGDRILDWKLNGQTFVDKVPHARLELVEGGHMLPVTRPDTTVRFIRDAAARVGNTATQVLAAPA